MSNNIDPKHIIAALVRQRDEALAKVAQLEAFISAKEEADKAAVEKKVEHANGHTVSEDIDITE